jgi:hypothetical protein
MSNINIIVQGANLAENNQMCSIIQSVLIGNGFTNVTLDPASVSPDAGEPEYLQAMRRLNPDLFDTPVNITGENDSDLMSAFSGEAP